MNNEKVKRIYKETESEWGFMEDDEEVGLT